MSNTNMDGLTTDGRLTACQPIARKTTINDSIFTFEFIAAIVATATASQPAVNRRHVSRSDHVFSCGSRYIYIYIYIYVYITTQIQHRFNYTQLVTHHPITHQPTTLIAANSHDKEQQTLLFAIWVHSRVRSYSHRFAIWRASRESIRPCFAIMAAEASRYPSSNIYLVGPPVYEKIDIKEDRRDKCCLRDTVKPRLP